MQDYDLSDTRTLISLLEAHRDWINEPERKKTHNSNFGETGPSVIDVLNATIDKLNAVEKQSNIIKDADRGEITSQLKYESVRADAMDMAYILDKIDDCLRLGCQCGGDYKGGIPYEQTVERLCKIMYSNTADYQKWLTRNQTKNEKEN